MTRTTQDGGDREEQPEDPEELRRSAAFVDQRHRHRRPIDDTAGINPIRRQGTEPRPDRRGSSPGRPPGGDAR